MQRIGEYLYKRVSKRENKYCQCFFSTRENSCDRIGIIIRISMSVRTHWDNLRSKIEPHMRWVIFTLTVVLTGVAALSLLFSNRDWQYSMETYWLYRGNAKITNNHIALVVIDNKTFEKLENSPIQDGKLTA